MNKVYKSWIFEENLYVVLDYIAVIFNCKMDEMDWTAIEYGIKGESQQMIEFDYQFLSDKSSDVLSFKIWQEIGDSHYDIEIFNSEKFRKEIDTVFSMAQMYELKCMN